MSTDPDQLRQAIGQGALRTLDGITDEVAEALEEFVPHLAQVVQALGDMKPRDKAMMLVGMAMAAALENE